MKKGHTKKISFTTSTVVELNDSQMDQLHGGSSKDVLSLIVEITTYGTWLTVL